MVNSKIITNRCYARFGYQFVGCKQLATDNTCATDTDTHTHGCSRVCTDCSRIATLLQPQILSSPKTARKMQISTQHATRPATGSMQHTADRLRRRHPFLIWSLSPSNMQHAALHLRSPALLPPPSLGPNECRLIVIKIGFLHAPDCATGRTGGRADERTEASAAKAICGMENCFAAFRLCVRHFKVFIFCLRSLCLPRATQLHPASVRSCCLCYPLSHRRFPPSRRFAAVSQFAICELLISTHSLISVSCSRWPTNRLQGPSCTR